VKLETGEIGIQGRKVMKIGVISDTHIDEPTPALRDLAGGLFSDVQMVLHAGDLTRIAVLEAFLDKEVVAVSGNMDQYDVTGALPAKQIVSVDAYRIGLTHGWGSHGGIEERVREVFSDVDAIVYGHTHEPANHLVSGVLLFNPGAFSGSRIGGQRSVGILTVQEAQGIEGEIFCL